MEDNKIHELQKSLIHIQQKITDLESENHYLKSRFDEFSSYIDNIVALVTHEYENTIKTYEKINTERLNIIQDLQKALAAYKLAMPIMKIKSFIKIFLRPHIGVLNQYFPKLLSIPISYTNFKISKFPSISIVTPSYNQGQFIKRTILSVIEQNYSNLEYIIQDGGSTDNTVEIIESYQNLLKFWESKKDAGQSNAINLGFKHATGEIMAYLNSDDILLPGTLNYVANYFNEHPDVDVIYGHRIVIDAEDNEIGRWILPPHDSKVLNWADFIPQETLFWRRRIWDKVGAYIDESFKFAMDWDLLLRFRDAGAKFARLPRFLGGFRYHASQKTSAVINDIGIAEMDQLRFRSLGRKASLNEIQINIKFYLLKHIFFHKLYKAKLIQY